jgi:hypothetical protein
MTLLDMQRALSRILTDKAFQQAFLDGDEAAQRAYDLTPRELGSLRGLRRDRVALHAALLAHGRVELALQPLRLTSALLHEQLHPLVDRFCAEYPPVPMPAGQMATEVARLGDFIVRLLDEEVLTPPWARDIVIYEKTQMTLAAGLEEWESGCRIAAANRALGQADDADLVSLVPVSGPHARVVAFPHDLTTLIPRLESGEIPVEVPALERPLRLLFVKQPNVLFVHTIKVNDATTTLLGACDGRRTVGEMLEWLAAVLGCESPGDRAQMEGLALAALRQMQELGVIALESPVSNDPAPRRV